MRSGGKRGRKARKKRRHGAQSLLPFNLWVIKIIISQRPSSIKEIDGGHRWTSTPTHTHARRQKLIPSRVWEMVSSFCPSDKCGLSVRWTPTHTKACEHTGVHRENRQDCTRIVCLHTKSHVNTHTLIWSQRIWLMQWNISIRVLAG